VPADKLLAETDSPYLAPQAVRGKRNEPAYVTHTYDFLAGMHGEAVRAQIVANAEAVFGL
jgi:TatD DNase family protein